MVSLFLFYCENGLLKQCENMVVSWGARGPGGAKRPGDVCSAPTEVERRPSVLRGPERERRPNPSLATRERRSKERLFSFLKSLGDRINKGFARFLGKNRLVKSFYQSAKRPSI